LSLDRHNPAAASGVVSAGDQPGRIDRLKPARNAASRAAPKPERRDA
jgi:hypothetical protein